MGDYIFFNFFSKCNLKTFFFKLHLEKIAIKVFDRIGMDCSKISEFKRHANDSKSPDMQVAQLTMRIAQLTLHLKNHKHDHATKRSLIMMIGRRTSLLRYLENNNRRNYLTICEKLGIKKSIGII